MYRPDFSYILTVSNIAGEDVQKLRKLMTQDEFFDGALNFSESSNNHAYFDCDTYGTISMVDRPAVEAAMHTLAMTFPDASFHLQAENVDSKDDMYCIRTFGNMYQSAELQSYMPALSRPVPFDKRAYAHDEDRDFLNEFIQNTDFNLLYQQKLSLLSAMDGNPLDMDKMEGLLNFLDFIGDWAEQEGFFQYPEMEQEEELTAAGKESIPKPPLDQVISSASDRVASEKQGQEKDFQL